MMEQLYKTYYQSLLRYACLRCCDEEMAKDIVQEVFLGLLEKAPSLEVKNWKAYLFILTRNETVTQIRKQELHRRLNMNHVSINGVFSNHDVLLEKEYRQKLHNAIQKLPVKQRLVYELRVEHNLKNEKVATVLNLSVFTVKNQIKKARRKLMEMVA